MQAGRIIYLFDPLCGWCYGAVPMLERLRADGCDVEAMPTGLFSGQGARPLDSAFAAYAWSNDQRIERLTGQIFSEAYRENVLQKHGAVFDSAAMTLGILAVGLADPRLRFDALHLLQKGRYVEGLDTADIDVVASLLDNAGFAAAADHLRKPDEALLSHVRETVANGQQLFRSLHANGVPAIVLERDGSRQLLNSSVLFSTYDNLKAHLAAA